MTINANILESLHKEEQQYYDLYVSSKLSNNVYDPYSSGQELYGKVDNNFNPIMLKNAPENLVSLGNGAYVLDYVADAYYALVDHIEETKLKAGAYLPASYLSGDSTRTSLINNLQVVGNDFMDPKKLYLDLLDNLFEYFSTEFITFKSKDKVIKNFKHFVKAFTNFTLGDSFPEFFALTYSGFMGKQAVTIESTGLTIRVQDDKNYELFDLYEKYKDDPTLKFFSNACRKHGFFVHRYSPSVLIADLKNPRMRQRMLQRGSSLDGDIKTKSGILPLEDWDHQHTFGIDSHGDGYTKETIGSYEHIHKIVGFEIKPVVWADPETGLEVWSYHNLPEIPMFSKYYDRTCNMDIDNIKKQILDMYNTFVEMYPFNQTYKLSSKNDLIPSGHYRKKASMDTLRGAYPDDFWLKYYIKLRLKEEKIVLSPQTYRTILKKVRATHARTNLMMAASVVNTEIVKRLHYQIGGPKKQNNIY